MTELQQFANQAGLNEALEVERVILLGFFHLKKEQLTEFDPSQAALWLESLHFAKPNISRLRKKLEGCREIVKGTTPGCFKLQRAKLTSLEEAFPDLENSEVIQHTGSILPEILYSKTRGYIESLASQINASYEQKIFDGCAVLMRRLMEILLILSFEHNNVGHEIKNPDGTYIMLDAIITKAKGHTLLKLSRNSRECIEIFRMLGNFSAHKIYYNCKQADIKKLALDYRALFEELLYKAGIRT